MEQPASKNLSLQIDDFAWSGNLAEHIAFHFCCPYLFAWCEFFHYNEINLDKSTNIRYYILFWYFNFCEFRSRRSGVSCSDWGRRRNPETKVLDFVERWIEFALPQINILTVLWFDSKIYMHIANLSVAGETWEKLPEEDTSFDK